MTIYYSWDFFLGTPDLSKQRTVKILDASRVVSPSMVSKAALSKALRIKRSILRHYIGNRDELGNVFAERAMTKYADELEAAFATFADGSGVNPLLDYLFANKPRSDSGSLMVIESLIAAAEQYPKARKLVSTYVCNLTGRTAKFSDSEYPQASRQRCRSVAYGLVGICFNQESLGPLKLSSKYLQASRACARLLVENLKTD